MSAPIYIVGTLHPAPGKTQEVIAAVEPFAKHLKATEPGCLQYEIFQPVDAEAGETPITFIELWKDMEALENVRKGEQYQALLAKAGNEGLLIAAPEFKVLQSVGGFGLR